MSLVGVNTYENIIRPTQNPTLAGMDPLPVPKVHEEILKKEVERLLLLEVLEVAFDSECGAPSFAQPKLK